PLLAGLSGIWSSIAPGHRHGHERGSKRAKRRPREVGGTRWGPSSRGTRAFDARWRAGRVARRTTRSAAFGSGIGAASARAGTARGVARVGRDRAGEP